MNPTIFRVSLDIHKIHSQFTLPIKRGDTSGKLIITLMQSGKPYEITEDCYAKFNASKDKSGVIIDHACYIQNNTIIYDFKAVTTSTAEKLNCEVILYGLDGQAVVSPRFTIIVHDSVVSEEELETSGEFSTLGQLISQANALIKDISSKLANGEFKGEKGEKGDQGGNGNDGVGKKGDDGDSAYDIAVAHGYKGTEAEWLIFLQGDSAYQVAVKNGFNGTEAEWLESLKGTGGGGGQLPQKYIDYLEKQLYKAPTISTFNLTGFNVASAEVGTALEFTGFTHSETDVDNIKGKLTLSVNGYEVNRNIEKSATVANVTHEYSSQVTTAAVQIIKLSGTDTNGGTFYKEITKNFYLPMYCALSKNPDETILNLTLTNLGQRLSSKEYEVTVDDTKYIYFASNAQIKKITQQGVDVAITSIGSRMLSVNGVNQYYQIYRTADTVVKGIYYFMFT